MRITMLVLLLSTLAACAPSSDGSGVKTGAGFSGPMSAEDASVSARLKTHAWCMRYVDYSEKDSRDIPVEERYQFLSNDLVTLQKFEMRDDLRIRKFEESSEKWRVSGGSIYLKMKDGTDAKGKVKFLESGDLNLVWELGDTGDEGVTLNKCE